MIKPAAGYRPLAYSSPEAVHTTGTVALFPDEIAEFADFMQTDSEICAHHRVVAVAREAGRVHVEASSGQAVDPLVRGQDG